MTLIIWWFVFSVSCHFVICIISPCRALSELSTVCWLVIMLHNYTCIMQFLLPWCDLRSWLGVKSQLSIYRIYLFKNLHSLKSAYVIIFVCAYHTGGKSAQHYWLGKTHKLCPWRSSNSGHWYRISSPMALPLEPHSHPKCHCIFVDQSDIGHTDSALHNVSHFSCKHGGCGGGGGGVPLGQIGIM